MKHLGTVTLETERLILRRFESSDAEAMFNNWASDAEVTKFLTWPAHSDVSVSKAVIGSWIPLYNNLNHYSWAIVLKEIGQPIGSIAVVDQRDDIQMVHIGYCIGRKWWRRGYASEALAELIRFFFEDVGVNRIESRHDPRNPNSGKVMQKCGLKYEGTLRQSDRNNQGGFCDAARYAMLAEDYFSKEKARANSNADFWSAIDKLVSKSKVIIDRPKGTQHPRFDFSYPLDYGYLENTSSMDGGGIDVWVGSGNTGLCDAIICTVDLLKNDSEIKLLLGCTEQEKETALRFHNDSEYMKGIMIRRCSNG